MQFENSFAVDAPIDKVWSYLLDVPSVAPCLPGAQLTETVSDTEFRGTVKIKLGAVQMNYKGTLVLKEVDEGTHRVVLSATGSDVRGGGGASGNVTSTLTQESPGRTTVHVLSELAISGRVAQFGRNIIQDVANKLIGQFAQCLEANLTSEGAQPEAVTGGQPSSRADATAGQSPSAGGSQSTVTEGAVPSAPHPLVPSPLPSGSGKSIPQGASEIKLLPIMVDITRTRVARGLRSLAKVLDPKE